MICRPTLYFSSRSSSKRCRSSRRSRRKRSRLLASATSPSPNATPHCRRTRSFCSSCRNTSARCLAVDRRRWTPINCNCCCPEMKRRSSRARRMRMRPRTAPETIRNPAHPTKRCGHVPIARGMLPVHLPRVDVVIDVESKICPCCGGSLHKIGETVKEMLDVVPVQYQVKRIVRPRYGCRGCESAVVQAPAPAQPIDGGMATEAMLAHVATMKYGYQVPLYRREQMLASQGVDLDRAT